MPERDSRKITFEFMVQVRKWTCYTKAFLQPKYLFTNKKYLTDRNRSFKGSCSLQRDRGEDADSTCTTDSVLLISRELYSRPTGLLFCKLEFVLPCTCKACIWTNMGTRIFKEKIIKRHTCTVLLVSWHNSDKQDLCVEVT